MPIKSLYSFCSYDCAFLFAKEKVKLQSEKKEKVKSKEQKAKSKRTSTLKSELQVIINEIVRLIDNGHSCISCKKEISKEKHDAGHLFPVSSNTTIRFNLLNIYSQCVYCNQHLGGNQANYVINLQKVFTKEELDEILELPQKYKTIKLHRHEIEGAILKAKEIKKELKQNKKLLTISQRIEYRKKINKELKIY